MNKSYIALIAAGGMMLCSCSSEEKSGIEDIETGDASYLWLSVTQRSVAENNNALAPQLLSGLLAIEPGKDAVVSPLSASIYYSMLANAAEGESQEFILGLLGDDDMALRNELNKICVSELTHGDPGKVRFEMANNIWYNSDLSVNGDAGFLELMSESYGTESKSLPFNTSPASSVTELNGWISEKTHGLINDFYKDDDVFNLPVAVVNTIYFKGVWSEPFETSKTKSKPFYSTAGTKLGSVQMMTGEQSGTIYTGDRGTVITLGYGRNVYEMKIFVPSGDITAEEAYREMLYGDSGNHYNITLSMPKFKIQTDFVVEEVLGVDMDRWEKAELSKISQGGSKPVSLGDMRTRQRAVIEVDEKGSEAAAVTGSFAVGSAGPVYVPATEFVVDHQFYYLIRERTSGVVIFMGAKLQAN